MGAPKIDMPPAPPPAPDLVDEVIRNAGASEQTRQRGAKGRRSTFLSAAMDEQGAVPLAKKTLLGA